MEIEWKLFILNFFIFLISFIVKGKLHFNYLKLSKNELVNEFDSFDEAYSYSSWSGKIMMLALPYLPKLLISDLVVGKSLFLKIKIIVLYQWISIISIIVVLFKFG
jgi:hypothetical protein